MKKPETVLKECVGKLSDENLDFIHSRLEQRMAGDLAACLDILSKNGDLDRWLATAQSSGEFFDMVDLVAEQVTKEYMRRNSKRKEKEPAS